MSESESLRANAGEWELVRSVIAGEGSAFDDLVAPHLASLYGHVRFTLRGRPDLDIDEVVQESLVRAYQAIDVFDSRYRFSQYLFGIAKFILRRHMCASSREVAVSWLDQPEAADNPHPPVATLTAAALALTGAGRFPAPDAETLDRAVVHEVLGAVLAHGGYPHQQLAFAFATVLWGKRKSDRSALRRTAAGKSARPDKVPITSDPERVVRDLSDRPLGELCAEFRRELALLEDLADRDLSPAFAPLDYRLQLTAGVLFANDRVSARRAADLQDLVVGDTCLNDYYGHDPRKSVADWIAAVKKRSLKSLTGRIDLQRSPLPMP